MMEMCLSFLLQLRHAHSSSLMDQPLDTSHFLFTLVRSAPHMRGSLWLGTAPDPPPVAPCQPMRANLLLSPCFGSGSCMGPWLVAPSLLPASLCYEPIWLLLHPPHFSPKNVFVPASAHQFLAARFAWVFAQQRELKMDQRRIQP